MDLFLYFNNSNNTLCQMSTNLSWLIFLEELNKNLKCRSSPRVSDSLNLEQGLGTNIFEEADAETDGKFNLFIIVVLHA